MILTYSIVYLLSIIQLIQDTNDWENISSMIPGKSMMECKFKWYMMYNEVGKNKLWTEEENNTLIQLVQKYGKQKWSYISLIMLEKMNYNYSQFHTPKQIREHYNNFINPNLKKGAWSNEEDNQLIDLVSRKGNKWSEIGILMGGRTENSVKNRYLILQKRSSDNASSNRLTTIKEEHQTDLLIQNEDLNQNLNDSQGDQDYGSEYVSQESSNESVEDQDIFFPDDNQKLDKINHLEEQKIQYKKPQTKINPKGTLDHLDDSSLHGPSQRKTMSDEARYERIVKITEIKTEQELIQRINNHQQWRQAFYCHQTEELLVIPEELKKIQTQKFSLEGIDFNCSSSRINPLDYMNPVYFGFTPTAYQQQSLHSLLNEQHLNNVNNNSFSRIFAEEISKKVMHQKSNTLPQISIPAIIEEVQQHDIIEDIRDIQDIQQVMEQGDNLIDPANIQFDLRSHSYDFDENEKIKYLEKHEDYQ